ncbi:MAG: RsmB/NOP family class I SAM-dependent RNA methyltransferase [Clostridia bacterium]|nr:RsmB/NOP family class I SAM-dependent RNA methyltransferase [Clostridia bacterium]
MIDNVPKFLIKLLEKQYGENIAKEILKGYKSKRKVTIRANTIKTNMANVKSELAKGNIEYETVLWNEDALILNNAKENDIRNLKLYQNGEIYLQSLSSMLPPIILNPKQDMDILDMCAAPGGKTTQIAALSENKSHITACEMNHIRMERLKYNIEKQGASCVYVMQKDARTIDDFFSFDSVLLDAPCSGSGTLNMDDSKLEKTFTINLINKCKNAQLQLLKKAIKVLKPGREMIYSTCSMLSCENEEILNSVLKTEKVEIVPINFEGIEDLPLLPTEIAGTLCVCPNELYEGFFIAKIRKTF